MFSRCPQDILKLCSSPALSCEVSLLILSVWFLAEGQFGFDLGICKQANRPDCSESRLLWFPLPRRWLIRLFLSACAKFFKGGALYILGVTGISFCNLSLNLSLSFLSFSGGLRSKLDVFFTFLWFRSSHKSVCWGVVCLWFLAFSTGHFRILQIQFCD